MKVAILFLAVFGSGLLEYRAQTRSVQRMTITVVDQKGQTVDARVYLAQPTGQLCRLIEPYSGEPINIWQYEPANSRSEVVVRAAIVSGYLQGEYHGPVKSSVIIQLTPDTSADVHGRVIMTDRSAAVGISASAFVRGEVLRAVTGEDGRFFLPTHIGDRQSIKLTFEKVGCRATTMWVLAGEHEFSLIWECEK